MLSIVIPCFNEEKIISRSINKILKWSEDNNLKIEVILVNNASTDNTLRIIEKFNSEENVICLNENSKGKGFAVVKGIKESSYNKVLILDADLSADIDEFNISWIEKNNLLVLGSRKLGKEINTPLIRKVSGKIFNLIERKVLNLNYKDIHCGFKYIASDQIMDIISSLDSMEFLYDLDLLLACRYKGFEIIENPVTYNFDRNSSVSLLRDPFKMLRDLFILKEKYNLNSFI
tara:strand:+ start:331 stop:1026 length:696 start_codon:yes stop_codon:yes gene_type:complete